MSLLVEPKLVERGDKVHVEVEDGDGQSVFIGGTITKDICSEGEVSVKLDGYNASECLREERLVCAEGPYGEPASHLGIFPLAFTPPLKNDPKLLEKAREILKSKETFRNYGSFFLQIEGEAKSLLSEWKEELKEFKKAGTVENLIKKLYEDKGQLKKYVKGEPRMARIFKGEGGNCASQTLLTVAAIRDSGIPLPEGYVLGVQMFSNHIQPVLYNRKKGKLWILVSNEKTEKIVAPVYHPKLLIHAYLKKQGEHSPEKDLLIAKRNVSVPDIVNTDKSTYDSFLSFPEVDVVYGDGSTIPETATLTSPYSGDADDEGGDTIQSLNRSRGADKYDDEVLDLIKEYTDDIKKNPKDADAYIQRARWRCDLGQDAKGMQDLSSAIEILEKHYDLNKPENKDLLAHVYSDHGTLNKIMEYTEKIKKNPKDAKAYVQRANSERTHRGLSIRELQDLSSAIENLEKYYDLSKPENKEFLAYAYARRAIAKTNITVDYGGGEKAVLADIEKANNLAPGNKSIGALIGTAYYDIAISHHTDENYNAAKKYARMALKFNPSDNWSSDGWYDDFRVWISIDELMNN